MTQLGSWLWRNATINKPRMYNFFSKNGIPAKSRLSLPVVANGALVQ